MNYSIYGFYELGDCFLVVPEGSDVPGISTESLDILKDPVYKHDLEIKPSSAVSGLDAAQTISDINKKRMPSPLACSVGMPLQRHAE